MCCDITVNKESVENMNIFVDADACPVVGIVEKIAENMMCQLLCFVIRTMCLHLNIVK